MSWELEYHNWSQLEAAGGASKVPEAITALEAATTNEAALAAYWKIDNTVVVQGAVYPAALPTVRSLLIGLARSTVVARPHILELLVQIGGGEPAQVAASNADIVHRCLVEIARGVPIYMDILERSINSDERAFCVDLLGFCCRVDTSLRERVRWYFEKVKSGRPSDGLLRLMSSWEEEIATATT